MRQRSTHIAEVHFEDLPTPAKVPDHFEDVFTHLGAAFCPGTHAKGEAPVRTASGDLFGAVIAVVMREEFRDAVHFREGRIVGVKGQFDPCLFRYWQNSLHEVSVVSPEVVGGVFPFKFPLLHFGAELVQIKLAGGVSATLNQIGFVGFSGMKVLRRDRNVQAAEIAEKAAIGFDILIAAGLTELHSQRSIRIVDSGEDAHSKPCKALLLRPNSF